MAKTSVIKGRGKLNKGEWAELYVLLKLLGEGQIYTANALLKKNPRSYLNILKIIREETKSGVLEYVINEDSTVSVKKQLTGEELVKLNKCDFIIPAKLLLKDMKEKKGNTIAATEEVYLFAERIYVDSPKAKSVKSLKKQFGGKSDIYIRAADQSSVVSTMGFSIKSRYSKSQPTLFNAGKSSQFLFELTNCNEELMKEFNNIRDEKNHRAWSLCKEFLSEHNIKLEFAKTKYETYNDNLVLVTDRMPEILAWCVKDRLIDCNDGSDGKYGVLETVERLTAANPCKVKKPDVYYKKMVKDLLIASFSGMTPGRAWDGEEQVNGGYIVVMENGDVLCYHSIDREAFRNYLYKNTHFEYVDTKKYEWSYIKQEGDKYYLPLNVSIRFNPKIR